MTTDTKVAVGRIQEIVKRSVKPVVREKYFSDDKRINGKRIPNGHAARLAELRTFRKTIAPMKNATKEQLDELWEKYRMDRYERGLMSLYQLKNWLRRA